MYSNYSYPYLNNLQKRSSIASEKPFSYHYAVSSYDRLNNSNNKNYLNSLPLSLQLPLPLQSPQTQTQPQPQPQNLNDELKEDSLIYNSSFVSLYPLYGIDWSVTANQPFAKLLLSSYREDSTNRIKILYGLNNNKSSKSSEFGDSSSSSSRSSVSSPNNNATSATGNNVVNDENENWKFEIPFDKTVKYPITRLQWDPSMSLGYTERDRFATTSECLRIYEVVDSSQIKIPDSSGDTNGSNATTNNNNGNNNDNIANFNNNNNNDNNITDKKRFNSITQNKKLVEKITLTNSKNTNFNQLPPMTSFDWNHYEPSSIITCSIDTTCTVWDLNRGSYVAKTQLIAHDSEVYDVKFIFGDTNVFTSCSADGSVRLFDLRNLEQSTIIYEPLISPVVEREKFNASTIHATNNNAKPLVRLATSNYDANHIAVLEENSNRVLILDLRNVGTPIYSFQNHMSTINTMSWHPRKNLLMTGGDDCEVLIYDMKNPDIDISNNIDNFEKINFTKNPSYLFETDNEVNNVCWSPSGDWVGINNGRQVQAVKFS